jgi:transposase
VGSTTISHGKRKGQGNVKNGNPYLEWASREAAQFAIRFSSTVQRFSQRKQAKSHLRIARKAVAHKLARAGDDILRALVPFDVHKAFG